MTLYQSIEICMEYNVSMYEWRQNIHLDVLQLKQSITTRYTLDNTPPTAHCPPGCRQPTDPSSGSGAPPGPARPHPAAGDRGGDSAWSGRWLQHSGWDHCHPNTSGRQMNLHLKTYSISISVSNVWQWQWIKRTEFRNATYYCPFLVLVGNNIVQLLSVCWPASDYLPEYWLVKVWCSDHAHVPMSRMERWRHRTATTGPCLHSSNFVSERRPESGAAPPRVFILSCCWPHRRLCYMLHVRARVAWSQESGAAPPRVFILSCC